MNKYLINDVFKINKKGNVIVFDMQELKIERGTQEEAYAELSNFISIGDMLLIEDYEEELIVLGVERFGKLMDPIIYSKNIGILIGNSKETLDSYKGKAFKIKRKCT